MKKIIVFSLIAALSATACHESDKKEDLPEVRPGFTIDPDSIVVRETGTPGIFKVALQEIPDPVVTIHASVTDHSEFTITPDSASLNHLNWTQGATFFIQPLDDGIRDGVQTVEITLTATSPSLEWNQLPPKTITVIVQDDGTIGSIDCSKTPNDPSCIQPVDCSKTPDAPSCIQPIDCEKSPDDPSCPQPVDCEKTPDDPSCLQPVDCEKSPDDPSCPQPVDCEKTPDDPSCPQPVDCEKTPNDPSCPQPVDCEKNTQRSIVPTTGRL